jgi:RND family efflux transporter MFP subunit
MRIQVNSSRRCAGSLAVLGAVAIFAACSTEPQPVAPTLPVLASLVVGADGVGVGAGRSWDGVVEATRAAVLSAQTSGRVDRMFVDVDDQVVAGAPLLSITATEQAASTAVVRAQLRAAEAQLAETESRYKRAADLVERQLVSRQDFEQVRAARDSAAAARDAATALLAQSSQQLNYTSVKAPYAGVISRRHVEPGEAVAPGKILLELYAPGALRVEVQVPQSVAAMIRERAAARIALSDGRMVAASRVIVYPSSDPGSHSVMVRLLLPEINRAPRPGETVRVLFAADGAGTAIWIPSAAVVLRGELAAVYVLTDKTVLLRQLRLGQHQSDRVEVIAGLAAGERIATDPLAAAQALMEQRATTEGVSVE